MLAMAMSASGLMSSTSKLEASNGARAFNSPLRFHTRSMVGK